jgi:hypothetical protein
MINGHSDKTHSDHFKRMADQSHLASEIGSAPAHFASQLLGLAASVGSGRDALSLIWASNASSALV